MAKTTKRSRKRYTTDQRAKILAAASKNQLTASDVQKRFGVKPVTYYSWRKAARSATRKVGSAGRRGRRAEAKGGLTGAVRSEVQKHIRAVLPRIVREETQRYLKELLG